MGTLTVKTAGAWASGSTSVSPALCASPDANTRMHLFVGCKPYNATIATPNGWTPLSAGTGANGTTGSGVDSGSVQWATFYRDWQTGDAAPSVSITSGNVSLAVINGVAKDSADAWADPVAGKGSDTSSDTAFSITSDVALGVIVDDVLFHGAVIAGNNATFGTPTLTATGATLAALTESPATEGTTATGNDLEASASYTNCTAGSSTSAPVAGWTLSAAQTGGGSITRYRSLSVQTITQASRFDNSSTFYGPTVTATVALTQSATFSNTNIFYAATVTIAAKLYYVIGPSAGWSAPSATQVKTGLLGGGGAATAAGNEASPTSTTNPFTFSAAATGLTSGTAYKIAFVWNQVSTDSNVAVSSDFNTTGSQTITQASRFDNSASFYGHTVTSDTVLTQASRFDGSQTFYAATITTTVALTQASRFDNSQTFYSPTVTSTVALTQASRFDNAAAFYGHVVTSDTVLTQASRFDNAASFYAAAITSEVALTQASRFDNSNSFYAHVVSLGSGDQTLTQSARFDNSATFYGHTVTQPKIYYVVGPSAGWSAPSATQVKTGLLGGGGAATASGNETSPGVTTNPFTFASAATGLTLATIYKVAYVWNHGATDSNVAVSADFMTTGAQTVTQASRFDNSAAFYAATITQTGPQTITQASRFDGSQTFHAATVTNVSDIRIYWLEVQPQQDLVQSARFDGAQTFYAPTITTAVTITQASRLDNSNTFYAATVSQPLTLTQSARFDNSQTFHAATVTSMIEVVQASRFDAGQIFYGPTITTTVGLTQASRFDNSQTFYSPTVTGGELSATQVWSHLLSNGMTAGETLVEIHTWMHELYQIHGLELGSPLVVTPTTRTAAAIVQALSEVAGSVTVTRQ